MPKDSPKKKSSSTPSPVKRIHAKHNVKSTLGQKARYELHTFETAVDEVIISYACRRDNINISAYIKPIVDHFNEQIEAGNTHISDEYKISSFMPRRVEGGSLTNNSAMKAGKDGEWLVHVSYRPILLTTSNTSSLPLKNLTRWLWLGSNYLYQPGC